MCGFGRTRKPARSATEGKRWAFCLLMERVEGKNLMGNEGMEEAKKKPSCLKVMLDLSYEGEEAGTSRGKWENGRGWVKEWDGENGHIRRFWPNNGRDRTHANPPADQLRVIALLAKLID